MKRPDVDKLLKKYQPVAKKTGEQLAKAAKAAEEDVIKMYKIAQTHVEIQMKNLQKERLYHEIGRDVAGRIASGALEIPELEKYKKRLNKIDAESGRMKKKLSRISKEGKRRKAAKKKK